MSVTITDDITGQRYDSWRPEHVQAFVQAYRNHPDHFQKAWDSEIEVMLESARTQGFCNDQSSTNRKHSTIETRLLKFQKIADIEYQLPEKLLLSSILLPKISAIQLLTQFSRFSGGFRLPFLCLTSSILYFRLPFFMPRISHFYA